jgi:hypothetical protein
MQVLPALASREMKRRAMGKTVRALPPSPQTCPNNRMHNESHHLISIIEATKNIEEELGMEKKKLHTRYRAHR